MENVGCRSLPSALDRFDEVSERLSQKRAAVFLDYDGTLTPIVKRPEDAILSAEMRETVRDLARTCTVAVVSGRDLADVKSLVQVDEIVYAGSHGFDISGPRGWNLQYQQRADLLPVLDEADRELRESPGHIPGVLIERKKFSIAIHYRLVADSDLEAVEAAVDGVRSRHPKLRKNHGKKVFELQPDIAWHKGKAVLWLLDQLGLNNPEILPIYIGDDVTDEDAFRALKDRGLGIVVLENSRETDACYTLRDPDEVQSFLATLTSLVRGESG